METHSSLLIQALPPILSSIGGFFVLLFFGYGKEQKEKRIMSAALLVLLVWIIYVCVIMSGEKLTLFSPYITVITLVFSIVLLSTVFLLNLKVVSINESKLISLFVVGIIFSTIGFVNYFGMKNRVVIAVKSNFCKQDIILSKGESEIKHFVKTSGFFDEVGFVLNKEDIAHQKYIEITCGNKSPQEYKLDAFNKSSRGLGVEYVYYKK